MVICHTDDQQAVRDRMAELGVRSVVDVDDHGYRILQLHPGDTRGSFLEIDFQPGGEDPEGPWLPAGPDWQRARRTEVVGGISAVEVQSQDPESTVARWAAVTGITAQGRVLPLDNATVTFVDGPVDSLVGVTLVATDRARSGEAHEVAGVLFRFG